MEAYLGQISRRGEESASEKLLIDHIKEGQKTNSPLDTHVVYPHTCEDG
jgi:hypothetical protein